MFIPIESARWSADTGVSVGSPFVDGAGLGRGVADGEGRGVGEEPAVGTAVGADEGSALGEGRDADGVGDGCGAGLEVAGGLLAEGVGKGDALGHGPGQTRFGSGAKVSGASGAGLDAAGDDPGVEGLADGAVSNPVRFGNKSVLETVCEHPASSTTQAAAPRINRKTRSST